MTEIGPIPCRRCSHANEPWRKYCGGCAGPLATPCRMCGFGNQPRDKFCGGCASALAPRAPRTRPPRPPPGKTDSPKMPTIQIDVILDEMSSTTSKLPTIPEPPR
jgi:hypothetical protein